jgi:hypothetical protein
MFLTVTRQQPRHRPNLYLALVATPGADPRAASTPNSSCGTVSHTVLVQLSCQPV